MIPWVVTRELRATLLDYLRSTWSIGEPAVEAALFAFLASRHGLFQGPYLRLALPFAPAPAAAPPLDIHPPYPPHQHQLEAWTRLSSRGQAPRATLITTGTGSGKTECFLYPVLDHALRERLAGKPGIKAVILYPMNALASDQAQRFAETIHHDPALRGKLRVGLFVGGERDKKAAHKQMGRDHVIDDNDRLRAEPPDILLTNYRMLDLLLQRPGDAPLWKLNEPGTLRYLVLDELHMYDGAQGTDVACLLRRLGHRLGGAEGICPVGTSATVGSGEATRTDLLRFASTLFDQRFEPDAFIGETRLAPTALLQGPAASERYPLEAGPWPEPGEVAEAHVRQVVRAWLPHEAQIELFSAARNTRADGIDDGDDRDGDEAHPDALDRIALGRHVCQLPIVRALLSIAHQKPIGGAELDAALARELPVFAAGTPGQRTGWLAAALSLVSYAQRGTPSHPMPLVSVQTTLWVREVRKLLSRVSVEPAFRFHDDAPPSDDDTHAWVPRFSCRDCGQTGWFLTEAGPGDALGLSYPEIARAYRERAPSLRILHTSEQVARQQQEADGEEVRVAFLDVKDKRLVPKIAKDADPEAFVRLFVSEPDGHKLRCPACGSDGLRMIAARSTTLSSVAVGHLFTTPLNTDRKLLAFSDSVQDATHRAGFYGARTYRFALRSAMLAAVPREGSGIPLASLSTAAWEHWLARVGDRRTRTSPEAELTAMLLPADLHWLRSVTDWHDRLDEMMKKRREAQERGESTLLPVPEPSAQLVDELRQRLRWECARELGVAARIGRTLEQSGCVAVTSSEEAFVKSVDDIRSALREKLGPESVPELAHVRHFLAGLLTRLRLRGGVCDPLLEPFVKSGGTDYLLSKQVAPLLSPFPRDTSRPLFLSSAPKPRRFDSICPSRTATWVVDWTERSLGLVADPGLSAEVYFAVMPVLVRHGLLRETPTDERAALQGKKAVAWGLAPEKLVVSRASVLRRCDTCGAELATVADSVTDLRDGPCLRFRCAGHQRAMSPVVSGDDEASASVLPVADYYRRFYERGSRGGVGRLWARDHTGLLGRDSREALELEFKQRPRPDSPNLLSCTPTLEMGIDIGDLSATLLCSVPPSASSYVQRVGRAGRKTGNALILAFAATRPHDLYFFEQPLEAMAGTIHPPGCYLSAPEVLKRQALAFLFDAYARDGGVLQGRVGDVLRGEESRRFPKPFFAFVAPRRQKLAADFLELFRGELTDAARQTMARVFEANGQELSPIERALADTVDGTRQRREELRALVKKLDERLKQLAEDPIEAKKVEDLEDETLRLKDERAFVYHQLDALLEQGVWGWLCEESRLPNYAFPERGVKLEAYIRREGTGQDSEHHTWVRAPASALTELAPFNTFYASARRVQIDGIELKKEAPPTLWRFCPSCHHTESCTDTSGSGASGSGANGEVACPACGDTRFGDVGQARRILPLAQVFSVARHRDAVLNDNADDRERSYYETVRLFEAKAQARDAWSNEAAGFGFELQPEMVLRQINLGKRDDGPSPPTVQIAGQTWPDVRFVLCATCGQAQEPAAAAPLPKAGPPRARHRAWCGERKKPLDKQQSRDLHLLRELRSEALRMVVPYAAGQDVLSDLANLRAALRVGLRRFYGGDPDFLDVSVYDEPLAAHEGRRRFLVIMDRVPGGTGMLAELCLDKGAKLKEALVLAYEALRACPCKSREPMVKACYQCLYAYREGNDLPRLDRARAIEIVEKLLEAFGGLGKVDSVGTMTQSSVLESELESQFLHHFERHVRAAGGTWEQESEKTWHLSLGIRKWLLRAQQLLGTDVVAVPCKPDFMLHPVTREAGVKPVAIFTDGLAYHVMPGQPQSRLADDARKRQGISQGGSLLSWSLTWKDVVTPDTPPVPRWIGDGSRFSTLQGMAFKLEAKTGDKLSTLLRILDADPLHGLLAYLEAPTKLTQLATLASFVLLNQGKRQPSERLDSVHRSWRFAETTEDLALLTSEGDAATSRVEFGEHGRLLVDVPATQLGALLAEPAKATLTLRLEDDAAARKSPTFEASWRLWLRAWNLLQAMPGAVLVTREATKLDPLLAPSEPPPPSPPAEPSVSPPPASENDPRLAVIREITDSAAVDVFAVLLGRYPRLEAPSVPFELRAPAYAVAGDVEVAFASRKVAVSFDHQSREAEVLRQAGWTVFEIERGLDVRELAHALGLSAMDELEDEEEN
jgi:DEAD/DEAH box helicase domain-containing protein